jgi:2-C-methyl-D-erythritol 2,4-cyclodiphosphate synthase
MFRVGLGFDMHPLTAGRPLILGGVTIPYEKGLSGHSDADVLLHAAANAVLGAAGEGDLGTLFSDRDPRYRGISSVTLLEGALERASRKGFRVENLDAVVMAQRPKLSPYLKEMRIHIAGILGVPEEAVNIKASSPEGLGLLGREEGMAAQAVCLLRKTRTRQAK